jgi:tripartite-type tricarboxylate transporter receptor subunit TctC
MPNPVNTTEPLLNPEHAKFDPRTFTWIGSINAERSTCGFWASDIRTADDLKKRELVIAASGPTAGSTIDAKALRALLGFKFRIVSGYPGLAEMQIAAQRGEADGYCGVLGSMLKSIYWDDFKAGRFRVPIQMGLAKHPDLPNIPNAFDAVQSEEDKQVFKLIFAPWSYGRPVAAPPGLPLERTETLRRAFQETMVDPAFLEEAKKLNIEVNPISHDEISRLLDELFRTPREVIERTRQVLEIEQR